VNDGAGSPIRGMPTIWSTLSDVVVMAISSIAFSGSSPIRTYPRGYRQCEFRHSRQQGVVELDKFSE